MASIRDVAKMAKTSVSTVSRVTNNSGYVSAAVRDRVEAAIQSLGYSANAGARIMRGNQSKMIGVLVPGLDVHFFGMLAHSIEQRLFNLGYHSLICNTSENSEHEARYVRMLLAQKVDGVIVASSHASETTFQMLEKMKLPCIAIDRPLKGKETSVVRADHYRGGVIMAEHLIGLGHKHIGIVGAPEHSQPIKTRLKGIRSAMKKAGLPEAPVFLGDEHDYEVCCSLARSLITTHPEVTAICGLSDVAAIGAMKAANELGKNIPSAISIIGYDDLPESAVTSPALTTVSQPIKQIGETAAEMLVQALNNRDRSIQTRKLSVSLTRRESTSKSA